MSANNDEYDRDAALATLSPEERAALEDDGLTDEERNALQNIAGQGDDEGDDNGEEGDADADAGDEDGDDDGDAGAADEDGDDDAGASSGADDQGAQADDVEEDQDDDTGPVYEAALPKDFEERVQALDTRADELAAKFKAGEIDGDQFIAETRKIADERAELEAMRTEVRVAERLNAQNAQHQWARAVKTFMKEVKAAEGIDYAKDPEKAEKFDLFVKALAGDPKNEGKSFKWYLGQAHKATKAVLGLPDKPAAGGQKPAAPAKPAGRKPPTAAVPKNLAQVPGSDGPGDVGGDEFAELDRLTGEAYEQALARLTPAQRERYLAQA